MATPTPETQNETPACEHCYVHPAPGLGKRLLALFGVVRLECEDCGERFGVFEPHALLKTLIWLVLLATVITLAFLLERFLSTPTHPVAPL